LPKTPTIHSRQIVAGNYKSVTIRDYVPYDGVTGKEALPNSTHQAGSGWIRQKPLNIPTDDEVRQVAMDTRIASAPADIMPRYKPHLHKIRSKDPVELENGGYVSEFNE
jgi:protein phosphatase 1 regulatory subunit 32